MTSALHPSILSTSSYSLPNSRVGALKMPENHQQKEVFPIPASHGGTVIFVGGGLSLTTVLLIAGIVLWAIGATAVPVLPTLVLAGKVMFSLAVVSILIPIFANCCCK